MRKGSGLRATAHPKRDVNAFTKDASTLADTEPHSWYKPVCTSGSWVETQVLIIPKTFNRFDRKEASNEQNKRAKQYLVVVGSRDKAWETLHKSPFETFHLEQFMRDLDWMSNRWHLMSFSYRPDTFPARLIWDLGYTFSFALYSPECWLCTRRINKGGSLPEFQVSHELLHGHGVQEHKVRLSEFQALVLCHDETPSVGVARWEMILTSCFEVLTGGWTSAGCSSVRSCSVGARCHSCVKSQSVNSVIFQQGRKAAEHYK